MNITLHKNSWTGFSATRDADGIAQHVTIPKVFYCVVDDVQAVGFSSTNTHRGGHGEGSWDYSSLSLYTVDGLSNIKINDGLIITVNNNERRK